MFLDVLSDDEKEWFLDLAIKGAEANGEVAEAEIRMLHAFAVEMKIKPKTKSERDLSQILKNFTENSSKKSKKVILFELIGILFSDSEFDEQEKEFLNQVKTAFGFEDSLVNEMISEINDYSLLFNRICKTVL